MVSRPLACAGLAGAQDHPRAAARAGRDLMRGRPADMALCRRLGGSGKLQRVIADGGAARLHGDLDRQHIIKPLQLRLRHAAGKLAAQILLRRAADLFAECVIEPFAVCLGLLLRVHVCRPPFHYHYHSTSAGRKSTPVFTVPLYIICISRPPRTRRWPPRPRGRARDSPHARAPGRGSPRGGRTKRASRRNSAKPPRPPCR